MVGEKMEKKHNAALGAVLFVAFVALGVVLKFALTSFREPPKHAEIEEAVLQVQVAQVYPEDVPVVITGYGEVRSLDVVAITPKVSGDIVAIHPRLELGEVISEGDLLFRIDPQDYEVAQAQAQAQAEQLKSMIARLKKQSSIDRGRLETLDRTLELARGEFERDRALYEEDDVGTESMVNASEISLNQTSDAHDQLTQMVELYPIRIQEAESSLDAAKAGLKKAEINLARTEVRAPFNARIKSVRVEVGQFATPGAPLLTLADDSVLEISVPLDSRDVRSWMRFEEAPEANGKSWFGRPEAVQCRIAWTEDAGEHCWMGTLNRVERFDQMTRTVTVAVRIAGEAAAVGGEGLPLVEGMFCAIEIPGKTMEQVYRLPRWAVSFEGQVHMAEDKRLKRRNVEVVRNQGEDTFVSSGFEPGELVVTTRLVNPLPNTLLDFGIEEGQRTDTSALADAAVSAAKDAS